MQRRDLGRREVPQTELPQVRRQLFLRRRGQRLLGGILRIRLFCASSGERQLESAVGEDSRDDAVQPHTFASEDSCRLTSGGTAKAASRSPRAMRAPPWGSVTAAARTRSAATSLRKMCTLRVATTDPEPCSAAKELVYMVYRA